MVFTESAAPGTAMMQRLPRFILVALLHGMVFLMIAQSMGGRSIANVFERQVNVVPIPKELPPPPPPPPLAEKFKPQPQVMKLPWIPQPAIEPFVPPDQPVIRGQTGDPTAKPTDLPTNTLPTTLPSAQTGKREPVRVKAVIDAGACTKPEYPKNSVRNKEEGRVVLGFLVGTDGRVIDSRIDKSSGYNDLDKAARQAVSLCRFKPGTVDGVPQEGWASLQYVWTLE